MSTTRGVETEVKLALACDSASAHTLLNENGFRISVPRVFEANSVYDTPTDTLRSKGQLLRLRLAGDTVTITWKGPALPTTVHKSRPEVEIKADDFERAHQLLVSLGYQIRFRYDKFRTEFVSADAEGTATLDETPIGTYMELEGSPDWIDRMAQRLGFTPAQYVLLSYGTLYQHYRAQHPDAPEFMTFRSA